MALKRSSYYEEEVANALLTMVANQRHGPCLMANRGSGIRSAIRCTHVPNRRESDGSAGESRRVFGESPDFSVKADIEYDVIQD
jgi:hypothetical protein